MNARSVTGGGGLSDETLRYGERVMTALLGVDALYRRESGDEEGLAVVNMDVEHRYTPDGFGDYPAARECWSELNADAGGLPEPDRSMYYGQLADSTLAFIEWRETGLELGARLEGFLHVPVAPATQGELDALQEDLRDLLNGMGYSGDLAAQCASWEARNRVPPDEVPGVLAGLMKEAWDRTEERLFEIPAPRSDGMRVATVTGVPFNARCDYLKRTVELNVDPVLTRPGLKHLTVHEAYPGHYVQFKMRETMAREGTAPADGLLSVVNTAGSSVFEGIADAGMEMLDWIDSDDDRVLALVNRHRAGIGTGAAWRLHALGWPMEMVTDWLRGRSLVGGEGWVANRMQFISAVSRAVLIWSYWWGERVVAPAWRAVVSGERAAFLRFLYGRMHSNTTVRMFADTGRGA